MRKHPKEGEVRRISPSFAAWTTEFCRSLVLRVTGKERQSCGIVEEKSNVDKQQTLRTQAS